jgi:hypothetical protein
MTNATSSNVCSKPPNVCPAIKPSNHKTNNMTTIVSSISPSPFRYWIAIFVLCKTHVNCRAKARNLLQNQGLKERNDVIDKGTVSNPVLNQYKSRDSKQGWSFSSNIVANMYYINPLNEL